MESVQISNWYECFSPDVNAAKAFYNSVFGWTSQEIPMGPDRMYPLINDGQSDFGGFVDTNNPVMKDVPAHWGSYFHTANCATTVAKVQELGGKISFGPMDIPDVGTVAGFFDCCGAHFSVHQPVNEQKTLETCPVNWQEHMGPNREGAVSFYSSLFGWGSMDMDMGDETGIYSMFLVDEIPVAGCMQVPAEAVHPNWSIYFNSNNLEETCAKVIAAGGKIVHEIKDIGQFGRIAIAADVMGAVFGIHEPPNQG